MRLKQIFTLLLLGFAFQATAQTEKQAWYYCIDLKEKIVYQAEGKATVKPDASQLDHYQYGFMKQKGWINKSWKDLIYHIEFISAKNKTAVEIEKEKLIDTYQSKNFKFQKVPMPYPMVPYSSYRKNVEN